MATSTDAMEISQKGDVPVKSEGGGRPQNKSYKRKYLKIRSKFNAMMQENNRLWEGEQKLQKIARRLEEELDQIRELLVGLTDSTFVTPKSKIDTNSSHPDAEYLDSLGLADLEFDEDSLPHASASNGQRYKPEDAQQVLEEARKELELGDITASDFASIERSVKPYIARPSVALSGLEKNLPHSSLQHLRASLPGDLADAEPIGYLTPDQETEYLERLDGEVDGRASNENGAFNAPTATTTSGSGASNHPPRDNPLSALNWLRKYHPNVLAADDAGEGKGSAGAQQHGSAASGGAGAGGDSKAKREPASRSSKRRSSVQKEVLDDDGFVITAGGGTGGGSGGGNSSAGSKRKRSAEDDGSYHPKSGSSRGRNKSRKSGAGAAAAATASGGAAAQKQQAAPAVAKVPADALPTSTTAAAAEKPDVKMENGSVKNEGE